MNNSDIRIHTPDGRVLLKREMELEWLALSKSGRSL
jgi:hypothetical protein